MFVGHAMLAFALAAGVAHRIGRSRERSLALGLVAGAFATVPDVDMLYALVRLFSGFSITGFWSTSTLVHRVVTHSLVVGTASAVAFALWSRGFDRERGGRTLGKWTREPLSGLAILVILVASAGLVSGSLGLAVMTAFALAGLAVATAAVRAGDLSPRAVLATALLGLWSHPFGDLFTGQPPGLFYPLGVQPITERVVFSPDPTLHLLGAFGVELAAIWMAAFVYCRLTDRPLREHVRWRAAFGVAYAVAALALPAPTVDSAYRFVFSVLAVGTVGPAPLLGRAYRVRGAVRGHGEFGRWRDTFVDEALTPALTGLAAVTLASVSFAVVYPIV